MQEDISAVSTSSDAGALCRKQLDGQLVSLKRRVTLVQVAPLRRTTQDLIAKLAFC